MRTATRHKRRVAYCHCAGCSQCARARSTLGLSPSATEHIERYGGVCIIPVAYAGRLCRWCERRQVRP